MSRTAENAPGFVAAMLEAGFYPHAPDQVELRETHISWVFLAGELVYKVKKPLILPFLDYGTLGRRRHFCHEEVRLNAPYAPGIYLQVVGIGRTSGTWALIAEDDPSAEEYAVEMRRIDEDRTVAALAVRNGLRRAHLQAVGQRIAELHAAAPQRSDTASVDALFATLAENSATLLEAGSSIVGADRIEAAQSFTERFESAHRARLEERAATGRVRECHGDLRAEHVVISEDEEIQIFDCVEFDPALREIDVGADIAFLVMELMALAGDELAAALAEEYRLAGGDPGEKELLAFFAAYRAWVRAKVACLRALELPAGSPPGKIAEQEARDRFALGHRLAWQARRPLVLVICGLSGTGKTTLANEIGLISGWRHISSDLVRKEMLGIEPTQRAGLDAYDAESNTRTYAALGAMAREELGRSGGVIVDATFNRRTSRDSFRERLGEVPRLLFVECIAEGSVLTARIKARTTDPARISDADLQVLARQRAEHEPLDELEPERRAKLKSADAPGRLARSLEALVDERLWPAPQ